MCAYAGRLKAEIEGKREFVHERGKEKRERENMYEIDSERIGGSV